MNVKLDRDGVLLVNGDALDVLRKFGDCTVDALVTDPPAGIGFMGKQWDSDKGGRVDWIAWLTEIMREAYRVMKPGAHGLVWALPRTSHWTGTALEDAGFEVRDRVSHLFGCVPLETEILTAAGWRKHDEIESGDLVVQVDSRGAATLTPLVAATVYPYRGSMVRIATRSTEQVITPGHTVHAFARRARWKRVDTDDEMTAMPADQFVEDHPGVVAWQLPLSARGAETRRTLESLDVAALYGWVISEGSFSHEDVPAVSIFQNEGDRANEIRGLLRRLGIPHSEYRRTRDNYDGTPRESVQWYLKVGSWTQRIRADLAGAKPTPPEWLAWLPEPEALALFDALVKGDGSTNPGGASGAWYQKSSVTRGWFQSLCFRLGYRTTENADKSMVNWSKRDSTEVQRGSHRARWASLVPFDGEVWCPTVASGRWVARYRGSVFVTGNTGFPKSLNVSKAIDKSLGAERPVVGDNPNHRAVSGVEYEGVYAGGNTGAAEITGAGSPEAAEWDGWGTALKPACEDWWLIRKPLDGTVAANVLEHGTGALNIDACRIGTEDQLSVGSGMLGYQGADGSNPGQQHSGGRWPAHLVLSHADECVVIGTSTEDRPIVKSDRRSGNNTYGDGLQGSKAVGTEAVVASVHACAPWCPVRQLDSQAPSTKSRPNKRESKGTRPGGFGNVGADKGAPVPNGPQYSDAGGPSRFFYVAKPTRKERDAGLDHIAPATGGEATGRKDGSAGTKNPRAGAGRTGGARNTHPTVKAAGLMEWLVRLITPPGGTVLDPFMGSGSTGIAAVRGGWSFVGVERDEHYAEIATARIEHAKKEETE